MSSAKKSVFNRSKLASSYYGGKIIKKKLNITIALEFFFVEEII